MTYHTPRGADSHHTVVVIFIFHPWRLWFQGVRTSGGHLGLSLASGKLGLYITYSWKFITTASLSNHMAWLLRWFVQTINGSKDNLFLSEHQYLEAGRVWVLILSVMAFVVSHPKVIYFIKWCSFKKSFIQTYFLKISLLYILKARTLLLCISILTRKQRSNEVPIICAKQSKTLQYINETWAFSKIQKAFSWWILQGRSEEMFPTMLPSLLFRACFMS